MVHSFPSQHAKNTSVSVTTDRKLFRFQMSSEEYMKISAPNSMTFPYKLLVHLCVIPMWICIAVTLNE